MQTAYQNYFIRCLSPPDFDALRRHLEPTSIKARQTLVQRNALIPYIYFLESGQASILAKVAGTMPIEVAMLGREGMTNMAPSNKVPLETMMQIGGEAHRIERDVFIRRMRESVHLAELTVRWQHAELIQTSYTAHAHGSFTVVQRLARYLLMVHDRIEGDDIPLVHDQFAFMLAVRRAGVTEVFRSLKDIGAVETGRGHVRVMSRPLLLKTAAGSYGAAEVEYEKLFGYSVSKSKSEEN